MVRLLEFLETSIEFSGLEIQAAFWRDWQQQGSLRLPEAAEVEVRAAQSQAASKVVDNVGLPPRRPCPMGGSPQADTPLPRY